MKHFDEKNNFDEIMKEKVRSEEIILPSGFNERNDNLIHDLITNSTTTDKRTRFHGMNYKIAMVLFVTILLVGSVTVAADYLSGGDFFARFFADKANKDNSVDYSYMNTDQLQDISSSTIGTVVDTDELKIEVLGAVASGNTANIMLRVTAKEVDSVIYDNGVPPLKNYRFYDDEDSLGESVEGGHVGYRYNDTDKSLADNQFKLSFTLIGDGILNNGECTFKLNKFGYWDKNLNFVTVYDNAWEFKIAFDAVADHSRALYISEPIQIGSLTMDNSSITISPFACVLNFVCDSEYTKDSFDQFADRIPDITLKLKDGTILDRKHYTYTGGAGMNQYNAVLEFAVPIAVEDVESITLFGNEYAIE